MFKFKFNKQKNKPKRRFVFHFCKYKIYCIDFPNGKKYIGFTSMTMKRRMEAHRSHSKRAKQKNKRLLPSQSAILKYWGQYTVKLLATFRNQQDALDYEIALIAKYKTRNILFGYNVTEGGTNVAKGFGGNAWTFSKTPEELKAIYAKLGKKRELSPRYGIKVPKHIILESVATRKLNGSYKNEHTFKRVVIKDVVFESKQQLQKVLSLGRRNFENMLKEGWINLTDKQINYKYDMNLNSVLHYINLYKEFKKSLPHPRQGKKVNPEATAKMVATRKANGSYKSRTAIQIKLKGVIYSSKMECMKKNNIHKQKLNKYIKNGEAICLPL